MAETKSRTCHKIVTPTDSMKDPVEKTIYTVCIEPQRKKPDYVAVIDVDPKSSTYLKVVNKCLLPNLGDELHNVGWNSCVSCPSGSDLKRDKLILPCFVSDRIYIIDVPSEREISLLRTIEPQELYDRNLSMPHSVHCHRDGEVLVSTLGDGPEGNAKGAFIVLDSKTFDIKGVVEDPSCKFGYDFWYQYKCNTLISSQLGPPKSIKNVNQFYTDIEQGKYGTSLDVWDLEKRQWLYSIPLGMDGYTPLQMRFLHDPNATEGYVACTVPGNILRFYRDEDQKWKAHKVIDMEHYEVTNWNLGKPSMSPLTTDILISLCDNFLFLSNWLHGDVRCYNIKNRTEPVLVSQVYIGGSIHDKSGVQVTKPENFVPPKQLVVKGTTIQGGAQRIQLSKDGRRLYVTTSAISIWDGVFYPDLIKEGSRMLKLDVNVKGNMTLDENFLVDFTDEQGTPHLAHEIRLPGGDCTSDIYVAE